MELFSSWQVAVAAFQQLNRAQVEVQILERTAAFVSRSSEEGQSPMLAWISQKVRSELRTAETTAARDHFELFFSSEPSIWKDLLSVPFGRPEEGPFQCKSDVLQKIESQGLHGYLELLVAAVNQHWSPVAMFDTFTIDFEAYDNEAVREHLNSVQLVAGVLDFIERDPWVMNRFRSRWEEEMPRHPFEGIRATLLRAVIRWKS
jgi:hypothetical protein